jgi:hypothetical protein
MKTEVIFLFIIAIASLFFTETSAQVDLGRRRDTTTSSANKSFYQTGNIGVGTSLPPAKLSILGIFDDPTIPGDSSTGILRIGIYDNEAVDIGKMGEEPYSGWIQAGYNGTMADPLSLQPIGGSVGIGTTSPVASAALDITSTSMGLLIPRMTQTQRNTLASPATGLMIYQTDNTIGLYHNSGTPVAPAWALVGNNAGQWITNGTSIYYNAGNVGIGITNPTAKLQVSGGDALINGLTIGKSGSSGAENSAFGDHALYFNSASGNTAVGYYTLYANIYGTNNTAIGDRALRYDSTGSYNTASGYQSLYYNKSGSGNTANGYRALYMNSTGENNTASGVSAMHYNSAGNCNAAFGYRALFNNETGHSNVAIGVRALYESVDGSNLVAVGDSALFNNGLGISDPLYSKNNTAIGSKALYSNITGRKNTACGSQALYFNTSGYENTACGSEALYYNTTGRSNTAVGTFALYSNTDGFENSVYGCEALRFNTTGDGNTVCGFQAMYSDSTGSYNTVYGHQSLAFNIDGSFNVAIGASALNSNSSGSGNIACGSYALICNTTGENNLASGREALYYNTTGNSNIAVGYRALYLNTTRSNLIAVGDSALYYNGIDAYQPNHATRNTAIGSKALKFNRYGYDNTAIGHYALYSNISGQSNTASGAWAIRYNTTGTHNTAAGLEALNSNITGGGNSAFGSGAGYYDTCLYYCTFIGYHAWSLTESIINATALGNSSRTNDSSQVRIGNSAVTSIGGYANWTNISDSRYKTNVQENVAGLDFVMKLRPVTYHLDVHKLAADLGEDMRRDENGCIASGIPSDIDLQARKDKALNVYTGFIAQEVEEAAKSIGYDFSGVDRSGVENGGPYGLRYAEFVVPLVKAMQEQQQMIEVLQKKNEELLHRIEKLETKD